MCKHAQPPRNDLPKILEFAHSHGGNLEAFDAAVRAAGFTWYQGTDDGDRAKLVSDTKLRTIAYGIIDRDANLTDFGRQLYEVRNNEGLLYNKLLTHIIAVGVQSCDSIGATY